MACAVYVISTSASEQTVKTGALQNEIPCVLSVPEVDKAIARTAVLWWTFPCGQADCPITE